MGKQLACFWLHLEMHIWSHLSRYAHAPKLPRTFRFSGESPSIVIISWGYLMYLLVSLRFVSGFPWFLWLSACVYPIRIIRNPCFSHFPIQPQVLRIFASCRWERPRGRIISTSPSSQAASPWSSAPWWKQEITTVASDVGWSYCGSYSITKMYH